MHFVSIRIIIMFIQWIRVDLSHAFKSFQLTIVFTLSGMDYAFYRRMFHEWFIFNIQEVSKSLHFRRDGFFVIKSHQISSCIAFGLNKILCKIM